MFRKSSSFKRQNSATSEKKTRWLLTRKTWRYMADAGRKLIPEDVQNKPENIQKIEENFQKLCQNEKKFLIWNRKLSYPGASGSFKRKNKNKVSKGPVAFVGNNGSSDEFEDRMPQGKSTDDIVVQMLEKYLNINSDFDESESEQQKNSMCVPRFTRERNNNNSNSQEPSTGGPSIIHEENFKNNTINFSMGNFVARSATSSNGEKNLISINTEVPEITKLNVQEHRNLKPGDKSIHSALLIDSLRQYLKKNYSPYLESDEVSTDLLQDKIRLRKILNDIRTQQKYSKTIPRTESTRSLNFSYSPSTMSLTNTLSSTFHNFVDLLDTKTSNYRNTSRGAGEPSGSRDFKHRLGDEYNMNPAFALTSSSPLRSYNSSALTSKTHHIYNQQKQIFADQQRRQLHQHQNQFPSVRPAKTVSKILKTISKTTTVSTSKPSISSNSQGILKNVPYKSLKKDFREGVTQTDGIPHTILSILFAEYKKQIETERQEEEDSYPDGQESRKPSIDNKDVSQSVSDTIKRYLMMARKKPKDNDAANRFKRVNYDRNLRNIKAKGETTKPGDDDGLMKGCQTDRDWLEVLFENPHELNRCCTSPIFLPVVNYTKIKSPLSISPSLPSSPPSPSPGIIQSGTQFLSNLFYHNNSSQSNSPTPSNSSWSTVIASNSDTMQKSKSSSNMRSSLMSKKIFRSRAKSQTRTQADQNIILSCCDVKPQWTPQGNGIWATNDRRRVQLRDVFLPTLTEVEKIVLEKQAQEKILQLGITLAPQDASIQNPQKPHKRRILLLKRKAVTTGIFDSKGKEDCSNKGGLVFGLPLEQCIKNDQNRFKDRLETRSSRSSLSSLLDHHHRENSGSCESLPAKSNAEYLHNTFLPIFNTNLDRRNSHDDVDLLSSNIPGVHSQLQQVPSIVLTCTKYLEENGLDTVGIFRVSTSKKRVRQLREGFDKGTVTTIDAEVCSHDIATLLKEFFRDLPEPLLCRHLYKAFLQTQSIRNRRLQLEGISHMIHLLPVAHRDTLYVLLKLLAKVARAANASTAFDGQVLSVGNKMDSTNLATIIAPNILHCIKSEQFEEREMSERTDVINIIRIMIDHYEDLFIVQSEDMNEIYTTMMDIYPLQLDYLLDRLYVRQEEDVDYQSGSSIPPLSPPYNQSQHAVFSDDEKIYAPSSPSATTTISTIETPKKVIYSREDILHENAGKGGFNLSRKTKERDIRARLKLQDPEKPIRRRRQSDRTESGDLSSSSSTHESYHHSSGISVSGDRDFYATTISSCDANKTRSSSIDSNASDVFESISRRMSSPLSSSHGAGVVTASLKIPVQASNAPVNVLTGISSSNFHGQNIQFYLHEQPAHNIGDQIADIPFIEDSHSSFELSDDASRKSSQSVYSQRPQTVTVITKRLDVVKTLKNHQEDKRFSSKAEQIPSKNEEAKVSSKKSKAEERKPIVSKIQMSSSTGHVSSTTTTHSGNSSKTVREPNYTPSISSIGSVLLRSKTADFERILNDQKKKSRISTTTQDPRVSAAVQSIKPKIQTSNPNVTNINISLKTVSQKKPEDLEKRTPIYKRQEIISSVKKS